MKNCKEGKVMDEREKIKEEERTYGKTGLS